MMFPKFAWMRNQNDDVRDIISIFLESRADTRWVLCHRKIIFSDAQLWTAWQASIRKFERGSALARSLDAEFLRYLAGTHHISEAFKRAGCSSKDQRGWLIYLPEATFTTQDHAAQIKEIHLDDMEPQAIELLQQMGCALDVQDFEGTVEGLNQLGIDDIGKQTNFEQLAISQIHFADLQN